MKNKISKNHQINQSKSDVQCKKHLKHRQSPGVCSVCLSERLSQLSSPSSRTNTTTMASSCSSLSSSHHSSESSPVHSVYSLALEAKKSITMSFLRSAKNVLTKSKSMASVARAQRGEVRDGKKKSGFWSKLLRSRSKKINEGVVHSRTTMVHQWRFHRLEVSLLLFL
ncbi:hypothetical protein TEA_025495 [Camellia sinensis var. sinensis]|uniref:Uncharacterized protein n=2 Tax=Camellia sinensis TaxID=4442 RepID=A0A4S4DA59_CAMSN|nr:hypothetical protein TEA_025495 [Camellia sinensis var. sinensis]